MDIVLGLVIEALFQWQQIKTYTIFIGYPSRGVVQEVCIEDLPCFAPTNPIVEVVPFDRRVAYVCATIERDHELVQECLHWAEPAQKDEKP